METQRLGCSLSPAEMAAVLKQYAQSATLYRASGRIDDTHADIHLCGDREALAALLDGMIAQEADCCSFLRFERQVVEDGYRVRLSIHGAPGFEHNLLRQAVPAFFPTAVIENDGTVPATRPVVQTTSRAELTAKLDRGEPVTLVEVLPAPYYRKAHLPGALNLPHDKVDELAPSLLPDKDAQIVTYCANLLCPNSTMAAQRLLELGYTDVRDYAAGKADWITAGLPIETRRPAAKRPT